MTVLALDHVNITCTPDQEAATIAFYETALGLERLPKPESQRSSGAWFGIGAQQIHLSLDEPDRGAQMAAFRHVCFRVADLDAMEKTLREAGAPIAADQRPIAGIRRFFTRDPAGNNVELAEHTGRTDS